MKHIISCFFVIILLAFSVNAMASNDEICFNSIPWLSDENGVLRVLQDLGFIRKDPDLLFTKEKNIYLVSNESLDYQPTILPEFDSVCFSLDLSGMVKGRIAGHPIKTISLTFAYDGSFKLLSVNLELIGADYGELLTKLSIVYGECTSMMLEEEGIISNIWRGSNNSAISLYTESDGLNFSLIYGRLDATEILSKCLEVDPDDVSGL